MTASVRHLCINLPDPELLVGQRITIRPDTRLRDLVRKTPRAHTRRIAAGAYRARSHRAGHPAHFIGVGTDGTLSCSCEAYTLGEGKACWAMKAVARRLLRSPRELTEAACR